MSKTLKIAIIGAGSTYTPELMNGILQYRDSLDVRIIYLMDIDDEKLSIVGGLCQRMIAASGLPCKVILTKNLDEALEGADFVVAQIRVGKLPARVLDEKIPLKYNLIGQETTGIGGFFKALRTIPELLKIAHRMEVLCKDAFLINFTNPSGVVAQALLTHSTVKAIGLCNVPINMISDIEQKLEIDHAEIEYVGLNHLSWITHVRHNGEDLTQKAIAAGLTVNAMKNIKSIGFSQDCIQRVQGIPSGYLEYFYHKDHKLAMAKAAEKCRGEICQDIEKQLLAIYKDTTVSSKPIQLEQRGGSKYSLAAISLIHAIANDTNDINVVNVKNGDCLQFMGENDVVEVACHVDKNGAHPIPVRNFHNEHIESLMKEIKTYEQHTVRAAVYGDEDEAIRALMIHPLIFDYDAATACFEELKQAHKQYLPQFFSKKD